MINDEAVYGCVFRQLHCLVAALALRKISEWVWDLIYLWSLGIKLQNYVDELDEFCEAKYEIRMLSRLFWISPGVSQLPE